MIVHKCDICRRTVGSGADVISAGVGYHQKELCRSCGKPVIQFLKKKKLIREEERLKLAR